MSQFTLADALTAANPSNLSDALRKVDLGVMLAPTVKTISQASATTIVLDPPALCPAVVSARVTGGTAGQNVYICTDAGGTAVDGAICKLSADGVTLTFAAAVTDAVVSYVPRSKFPLESAFAFTAP